ncbi:MAG: response regulator [Cognatishimia sp.]
MSLERQLAAERRTRLAAERLLAQKEADLNAANAKLADHALYLSSEIQQTRAQVENFRHENTLCRMDLQNASLKARSTEQRLWHAIAALKDGFVIYDAQDRLVMANRMFAKMFDDIEDIQPGMTLSSLLMVAADQGIIKLGEQNAEDWLEKMLACHMDPSLPAPLCQLWNGTFVRIINRRSPSGDLVSLYADVTESQKSEEDLRDARKRAEAASRAKSAFLANMGHELRTPMNGVVGMAELLLETSLTEEQRVYVDTINGSGNALLTIINDVLDYSKIEAEMLVLRKDPFDFEICIHQVMRLLQPLAKEKNLSLLVDYDLFLPTQFLGDSGRIRQIFTNLIGNAVKFTNAGHVLVQIVGTFDAPSQTAQIHALVQDTGIGIPAEHISQIFERFHQVEAQQSRQFEGTGLGLAISKRLVEMMAGKIWVVSEEGQGSSFGMQFPLPIDPVADQSTPQLPEEIGHVVVVDDEIANRSLLEKRIKQMGARATGVSCTSDALASVAAADLVLARHDLPGCDCLSLVTAMRDSGFRVPILVFSSSSGLTHLGGKETDIPLEIRGRLGNPFTNRELLAKLINTKDADSRANIAKVHRKLRVLAADDNKTNRLVLEKMLKACNITLKLVSDGQAAIEVFKDFQPDVIFMDISMPKLDGRTAAAHIRRLEKGLRPPVTIIALTAHVSDEDHQSILAAGINQVMTKPLNKQQLVATLDIVDRARKIAENAPKQAHRRG